MKRILAIAAITAIMFATLSLQNTNYTLANPYGYLPPSPSQELPTVYLNGFDLESNYSSIIANFTVASPSSWGTGTYIEKVEYKFDSQKNITLFPIGYDRLLAKQTSLNASANSLGSGEHSLAISVSMISSYNPPPLPSNWLDPCHYYATLTQMIYFTLDTEANKITAYSLPHPTITSYTVLSKSLELHSSTPAPTGSIVTPTTPAPSIKPPMVASLSESASALNFGNRINFTVSVEGGKAPYTYTWYVDDKLAQTSNSPYYTIDSSDVGSHHVNVEVADSENSPASTLTVEFNVLPASSSSISPSASPTQQPTVEPTQSAVQLPTASPEAASIWPNNLLWYFAGGIAIAAVILLAMLVLSKRNHQETNRN